MPPIFAGLRRYNADLLLLGVALVWGSSYLATKVLTLHASVFAILASRFVIAGVLMLLMWSLQRIRIRSRSRSRIRSRSRSRIRSRSRSRSRIRSRSRSRNRSRNEGRQNRLVDRTEDRSAGQLGGRGFVVAVVVGGTQALILSLETWGVSLTSATNAGLIISMTIVFTPVIESVWLRRWLPRPYFVAATVAVVGVALLVSGSGWHAPTLGDLLMLAAAAIRSVHVTALGRLTAGHHYSSVSITLVQTLVCAVLFVALDVPGLSTALTAFTGSDWLVVIYLALACTVFAFLVQLWAVRRTSAARVSLLLGTEPIWAVVIGVSLGGEILGWLGFVGAALIIAGSYRGQAIETRFRGGKPSPGAARP